MNLGGQTTSLRSRLRIAGALETKTPKSQAPGNFIHDLPLFKDISAAEKRDLFAHEHIQTYHKGQVIFYEGRRPTGLYFVKSGKVKVAKKGLWGKDQIVRLAKPGDNLTYRAMGGVSQLVASATALEDSEISFIDIEDYFRVVKSNAAFAFRVIQILAQEFDITENKLRDFAQKNVRQRLAEMLLWLHETYGTNPTTGALSLQVSRDELANMVGTATENVVRILSEFRKKNILDIECRNIRIVNSERLRQASNPDNAYSAPHP